LVAELRALRAEVNELRQQSLGADTQKVFYAKRTADMVTAVVQGGQSFAVRDED
jgi:hypothetical protein